MLGRGLPLVLQPIGGSHHVVAFVVKARRMEMLGSFTQVVYTVSAGVAFSVSMCALLVVSAFVVAFRLMTTMLGVFTFEVLLQVALHPFGFFVLA
jgi:hypothetical protein